MDMLEPEPGRDLVRSGIVMLVLFGITNLMPKFLTAGLESASPWLYMLTSWSMLLVLLLPCAYFAGSQRQSLDAFGVTTRGAARSLLEGALLGAVAAVPLLIVRARLREVGEPFFSWKHQATFTRAQLAFSVLQYPFHGYLQELMARGVLQGSLTRFMSASRPIVPILLTSCLFGIAHLYVSLGFALAVTLASLVFGLLYHRHQNLLGVTLAHVILGLVTQAIGLN